MIIRDKKTKKIYMNFAIYELGKHRNADGSVNIDDIQKENVDAINAAKAFNKQWKGYPKNDGGIEY